MTQAIQWTNQNFKINEANMKRKKKIDFRFISDWIAKWNEFMSQSCSVAMQNQSKCEICEANVKSALGSYFFEA